MHGLDYFCSTYEIKIGELAQMLGVKQPQINSWKKGTRDIPEHHLRELCDIFTVPLEKNYLFKKTHLDEIDRLEIEICLNRAKIRNLEETYGDQVSDGAVAVFEMNINNRKRLLMILEETNRLKLAIFNADSFKLEVLEKNLQKVRELTEEIKKGGD